MSEYSISDVLQFIEENDVKFIRLAFCDLNGNQKNISIMPQQMLMAYESGVPFDSFQVLGYKDHDFPDLYLKPDLDTLHVLPWRPQSGRVIRFYCDVVLTDGSPYTFDCRKFLKDTLKECEKMDFTPLMGLHSEFYLFKTDENGNETDEPYDQCGYLDVAPKDKGENIRREICLTLEQMDILPESSHHERGPGQNEIDFAAADALTTADHFVTYKNVVENIASRNGAFASFDPQPIEDKPGNGLHMKVALFRENSNIIDIDKGFCDEFMAGVFNRMKDITVFLNCREDSYRRFGRSEAPKYITWSAQRKSRLMRVLYENGRPSCFILRSPDSSINPYLACAMVIRAGLEGVKNHELLPQPQDVSTRNLSEEERRKYDMLPMSLFEAVEYANNSQFLKNSGFANIAEKYVQLIKTSNM
ncbi:MAG: glutamine synthetase [Pseudobutyrivibrio sp.]|nr:glutamine synthetase [Pseudobutyrivibrio sp.]